ncbi:MAG: hypothetical protein WDA07_08220 [Leucobacter sp.]
MDQIQHVEPGPDGNGWWPQTFATDQPWADNLHTAWTAVINYPTLQARRNSDQLHLRDTRTPETVHTYQLTPTEYPSYLVERIT